MLWSGGHKDGELTRSGLRCTRAHAAVKNLEFWCTNDHSRAASCAQTLVASSSSCLCANVTALGIALALWCRDRATRARDYREMPHARAERGRARAITCCSLIAKFRR